MGEDALLALGLLLHYYYCFDCFGFSLVYLHLLRHALYLLRMDLHPCLYICIYTQVFSVGERVRGSHRLLGSTFGASGVHL